MSVSQLASGRWRAQVHDASTRTNVAVGRILLGSPSTFATKEEAMVARAAARLILQARPRTAKPLRRPTIPTQWRLASKGETQCRACGEAASHLHHIVPRVLAANGRRDWERNGLPLCKRCHRGWHDRACDIAHDIFSDAEFMFACELAGVAWVERHYTGDELAEERHSRLRRRRRPQSTTPPTRSPL